MPPQCIRQANPLFLCGFQRVLWHVACKSKPIDKLKRIKEKTAAATTTTKALFHILSLKPTSLRLPNRHVLIAKQPTRDENRYRADFDLGCRAGGFNEQFINLMASIDLSMGIVRAAYKTSGPDSPRVLWVYARVLVCMCVCVGRLDRQKNIN